MLYDKAKFLKVAKLIEGPPCPDYRQQSVRGQKYLVTPVPLCVLIPFDPEATADVRSVCSSWSCICSHGMCHCVYTINLWSCGGNTTPNVPRLSQWRRKTNLFTAREGCW